MESPHWIEPFINWVGSFGIVVFAISGALAAGRRYMDPIGYLLVGTVTAIGGGTVRDLLLGRPVFWIEDPTWLLAASGIALATYFTPRAFQGESQAMVWADALGLAAFAVQGAALAFELNGNPVVAVVMGVMTAVGGGLIRDLIVGERPYVTRGELYASAALLGAVCYVGLIGLRVDIEPAMLVGFSVVLIVRGAAIVWGIEMGTRGEGLFRVRRRRQ